MAHFAQIDEATNLVTMVGVLLNSQTVDGDGNEDARVGAALLEKRFGGRWIQTSYNTRGGMHELGGTPLRANYCGRGWVYNEEHDIFHPQQPFPSWTLDAVKGEWIPPVPYPEPIEGEPPTMYEWNEDNQNWDKITQ